jgi:hypothetical protein
MAHACSPAPVERRARSPLGQTPRDAPSRAVGALLGQRPTAHAAGAARSPLTSRAAIELRRAAGNRAATRALQRYANCTPALDEPEVVVTDRLERKEPSTSDCSPEQRRALAVAVPLAKKLAEHAMALIDSMERGSREEALLKKVSGTVAVEHGWA